MQKALEDATAAHPHINNACWDTDSDETQESAVEELRYIVDSLFELASPLHDVVKCTRDPELSPVAMFYKGLIIDKFPNTKPFLVFRAAEGNRKCHERFRSQPEEIATPVSTPRDRLVYITTDINKLLLQSLTYSTIYSVLNDTPHSVQDSDWQTVIDHSTNPAEFNVNDTHLAEPSRDEVSGETLSAFHDSGLGSSQYSLAPPPISLVAESVFSSTSALENKSQISGLPKNPAKTGHVCLLCSRTPASGSKKGLSDRKWR